METFVKGLTNAKASKLIKRTIKYTMSERYNTSNMQITNKQLQNKF